MRCPNCGGLNADNAKWCGQCLVRFDRGAPAGIRSEQGPTSEAPPVASPEAADLLGELRDLGDTGAAGLPPGQAAPELSEDSRAWRCPTCGARNAIAEDRCRECGTGLFEAFRSKLAVSRGVKGSPELAAGLSVVPGLGHLYLRRPAEAALRFILAVWWAGTAWAIPAEPAASLPVRILFIFATVALVGLSMFDAYRQASDLQARPILGGRILLYWSLAMIAILTLGLMFAAAVASR